MNKMLRYGVIGLAALTLIFGVILAVTTRKDRNTDLPEKEKQETADGTSGNEVQEIAEEPSENGASDAVNEEENLPSVVENETPGEGLAEPESAPEENAPEESIPEGSDAEGEDTEEASENEAILCGLRKYFDHKLCIDDSKVSLYLNVRAEASEDGEILSVINPGDIIPYIQREGNWYRVQMADEAGLTFEGFVNADFVLADEEAYDAMHHSIAYAAMAKESEIILYETTDDSGDGIQFSYKGDAYRITGVNGRFFQIYMPDNQYYSTLYVRQDDVIVYYLFQGPGDQNGLAADAEWYLESLEISQNITRTYTLIQERQEELAAYYQMSAYYEQASMEAEAQYLQQSWAQASVEAEQQAIWASQYAEQLRLQQEAQKTAGESGLVYLGNFRITAYCHCTRCCGIWGHDDPNYPATGQSGMQLVPGYTVAVDPAQIPFGTRLMIDGKEYVAADSGVPAFCIDVYYQTHEQASLGGMHYSDVYLIQ